jgi:Trk-type K+ transport system membrane component
MFTVVNKAAFSTVGRFRLVYCAIFIQYFRANLMGRRQERIRSATLGEDIDPIPAQPAGLRSAIESLSIQESEMETSNNLAVLGGL